MLRSIIFEVVWAGLFVIDNDDPKTGGWRFFLWWMLTYLGFPLGGLLALVLVGSVEGVVSAAGEQVFGRPVQGKSAQVAGDPEQPHTYTYVPDLGRGLVILGEREGGTGARVALPKP